MEILYRGQTRRGGKKVRGGSIQKIHSNWVYGGIMPAVNSGDFATIFTWEPKIEKFPVWTDTVGRYTGKKDRDGDRIFEGDIVALCFNKDFDAGYKRHYKVQWDDMGARFVMVGIGTGSVLGFNDLLSDVVLKVVGNIFDSPELVEEGVHE